MSKDLPDFTRGSHIDLDINFEWTTFLVYNILGINRLDDKGKVLFFDSFEDGLVHFGGLCEPDTGQIKLNCNRAKTGGCCLQFITPTPVMGICYAFSVFPIPVKEFMGLQFTTRITSTYTSLTYFFLVYTGSYAIMFGIKVQFDGRVYVYNEYNNWTYVTDLKITMFGDDVLHDIKLVFDTSSIYYKSLQVDYDLFDISTIRPSNAADTSYIGCISWLQVGGVEIGGHSAYIDDIIITEEDY